MDDKAHSTSDVLENYMKNAFKEISESWRYNQLLRSNETPIDAPVYVELETNSISSCFGIDEEIDLENYIASLREIAALAPDGCRVTIEYEREGDYDGPDIFNRRIGYYRPPTEEERAQRAAENMEIAAAHAKANARNEDKERAEFERLQAKYGPR